VFQLKICWAVGQSCVKKIPCSNVTEKTLALRGVGGMGGSNH
jgi:hypothetical protein